VSASSLVFLINPAERRNYLWTEGKGLGRCVAGMNECTDRSLSSLVSHSSNLHKHTNRISHTRTYTRAREGGLSGCMRAIRRHMGVARPPGFIYIIKADMFVCLFRMASQTAGPIETKLDTRTHVHPGSVSGKVNVKVIHVCVRE